MNQYLMKTIIFFQENVINCLNGDLTEKTDQESDPDSRYNINYPLYDSKGISIGNFLITKEKKMK